MVDWPREADRDTASSADEALIDQASLRSRLVRVFRTELLQNGLPFTGWAGILIDDSLLAGNRCERRVGRTI
jgi:hypothetical protein